jgi:YD repeat-containing protein
LWACGINDTGRLGDNTVVSKSSPIQIGALTDWLVVSPGGDATAAIKTSGTLWTWGSANRGVLGSNSITPPRSSPVQVGSLTNWATLSTGNRHTLAVKTDGTLWAWGYNRDGAIGDSSVANRSSPVQVGALTNWKLPATGSQRSCSIKTDGTLWAWGLNIFGQLGDGTVINRSSPVQVGALTDWLDISGGSANTLSTKTDGTLWAWGYNGQGQLGDGTVITRSSPVQVGANTNWSKVGIRFNSAQSLAITKG